MLVCTIAKIHADFSWPESTAIARNSAADHSRVLDFERDAIPEAKHFHKVKKLKKKLLLLCLLGGNGRKKRSVPAAEGKFFFPVIQHTDVSVGGSGTSHLDDSSGGSEGSHGGFDCKKLMGSGLGTFGHPLVSGLLGGGSQAMTDTDDNRFYRRTIQRNVVRPLYQSMKHIYRLFK